MGNYKDSNKIELNKENEIPVLIGRWTNEEHQKFVEAIAIYGKNWKKVADLINTRTTSQIRSHAQKYFNKIEKNPSTRTKPFRKSKNNSLKHNDSIGLENNSFKVDNFKVDKKTNFINFNTNYQSDYIYKESLSEIYKQNKKSNSIDQNYENSIYIHIPEEKFKFLLETVNIIEEEISKIYNLQKKKKLEKQFHLMISQFKILFETMISMNLELNSCQIALTKILEKFKFEFLKKEKEDYKESEETKPEFYELKKPIFYIEEIEIEKDYSVINQVSKKNSIFTDDLFLVDCIEEKESDKIFELKFN